MLGGVGRELVDGERNCLGARRLQHDAGPHGGDALAIFAAVRSQLLIDQGCKVGAFPARLRQEGMRSRQRADAALDGGNIGLDIACAV